MAYTSDNIMFRSLNDEQEEAFRQHARENGPDNLAHWEAYHPVCRDEWTRRGIGPDSTGERWQMTEFLAHGEEATISEHDNYDDAIDAAHLHTQQTGTQTGVSEGIPTDDAEVWDWELRETVSPNDWTE